MDAAVSRDQLRRLLAGAADVWVYDILDSTNNRALQLAKAGCSCDALIVALEQSAGKGTKGRSFFSPKGSGLYLSVLMQTGKKLHELTPPTPSAAVAVARAIEAATGLQPQIKWINDIQLDGRKVCGILAESYIDPKTELASVVIGVGINITTAAFPAEFCERATSIASHAERCDINALAAAITTNLLTISRNPDPSEYLDEYIKRSSVLGKAVRFMDETTEKEGIAIDITPEGHLLVDVDGDVHELQSSGIML